MHMHQHYPNLCIALQLLASHLSWPSVLDARQTCRHWAAALDPLITHLRVPLTVTAPGGEQLAALLPAALDKFTGVMSVTLLLTPSTTAQGLQEALHTVGSKVGGQLAAPQISGATLSCGYCHAFLFVPPNCKRGVSILCLETVCPAACATCTRHPHKLSCPCCPCCRPKSPLLPCVNWVGARRLAARCLAPDTCPQQLAM